MILGTDGAVLFTRAELACAHCGECRIMEPFTKELRHLRERFNRPMKVNSCCRCPAHNKAVGGHPRSLHMFTDERGTCAIDIHIPDGHYRHRLVLMALEQGFSVGIYHTGSFIHLDLRTLLGLQPQVFTGA